MKKIQPKYHFYEYSIYMDRMGKYLNLWLSKNTSKYRDLLFQEIWTNYHRKLQVYTKQFYQSNGDYADRASEILLKVFESIDKYKCEYSLSTWIYTIARNYLIDLIRKKEISSVNIDDHVLSDFETPESLAVRDSEKTMVRAAISDLSSVDRELIYLYFYEGMKYHEISKIMGMPTGTIKYRMSENRKQMKTKLERSMIL